MGLSSTHIKEPARRDRLLMLAAFAQALLTLLGAASEASGLDRMLKANTVKKRTHSLFRQDSYWYLALPNLPEDRLRTLWKRSGKSSPITRSSANCSASYEGMPQGAILLIR